jgi:hypothetical protein
MSANNFGSAVQFNKIPQLGVVPEKSATAPVNPVACQLWSDTSVTPNKLRWYDSTQWIAADGTSIPNGYITDVMVSPSAAIALTKLAVNPLARANHTGTQTASTISDFDTQVRTSRLDQMAAPTSTVGYNGQRITSLSDPTLNTDAATKQYVDNARAGIAGVKDPVRVATQSNVNLAAPGTSVDSQSIPLSVGDRFLAAAQTTAAASGIYVYNGASTPATRASDADGVGEIQDGTMVAVSDGAFAGYQFIQTATPSGAPGSWTPTWVVFQTGGQTYTAGTGLTLTGTQFSLNTPVSLTLGGTGAATATAARVNLGAIGKFVTTNAAWTAGVTYTITHGLGTADVGVTMTTTADGHVLNCDWAIASAGASTTAITVGPDIAFAAGAVKIAVFG